jgi:transposase
MPKIQNRVTLSEAEIELLEGIIRKGTAQARVIRRAHTLLLAHQKKLDQDIGAFLQVNHNTVSATRQRYHEVGLPAALYEKPRPGGKRRLDGKQDAFLVALACSDAPNGSGQWTMQLLADKLVELGVVDSPISDETVRRTLKKKK